MAHLIHMHLEPDGAPCDSSPQGVPIPDSEREVDMSGQIAARLEIDCAQNRTVRIEYSLDVKQTWITMFSATPPVVDSCSRTRIYPVPEAAKTAVWVRAVLVGAQSAVCRLINLETLDASG